MLFDGKFRARNCRIASCLSSPTGTCCDAKDGAVRAGHWVGGCANSRLITLDDSAIRECIPANIARPSWHNPPDRNVRLVLPTATRDEVSW